MRFEKGFFVGAATAAHQVEGNNRNSDDYALELLPHGGFTEPSGIACDHYNRYAEDIALMKKAGLNTYRFSIEWARIEPEEGVFDEAEIDHYRKVIACCRENGIEPVVTLFHFTSPVWVIKKGGWECEEIVKWFRNYVDKVIRELGADLHYIVTINEANMRLQIRMISERYRKQMQQKAAKTAAAGEDQVQVGYNLKLMMEGLKKAEEEKRSVFGTGDPKTFVSSCTEEGDLLVMKAHEAAREVIRKRYPDIQVGLSLSLHDIQSVPGGEENAKEEWDQEFLHYLPNLKDDDFIGIQNYTRAVYGADGQLPNPEGASLTQMGYEDYPEGLYHVLCRVHESFPGNLFVTENGIATDDDEARCRFLTTAISGVMKAKSEGIPVIGYTCWSLLDNFEWQKGYAMRFGLVSVDRKTMERAPKKSLHLLGSFAPEE